MANVNKVILVGRLTRDVECRTFSTGGKVAKFGFCVNNRKKNSQTGQWEDEPMFIDCEAYNRGDFGKLADIIEQYLRKGSPAYLEGKLHLDTWDDKTSGQKRQKHKLVVDAMQMLDGRGTGASAGGPAPQRSAPQPQGDAHDYGQDEPMHETNEGGGGPSGDGVPF